jgi:molybdopterin converting factor small subunit
MKIITMQYFAQLSEEAKCAQETVQTQATTLTELFEQMRLRHSLSLPMQVLKPVSNDQLVAWNHVLSDGDIVSFLPPFSGG